MSLIPSGTDIAVALGLSKYLRAVSHACDAPEAAGLPVATRSIIAPDLSPRQIDDAVGAALSDDAGDGSLYRTDRALLEELQPDVILTQAICDVCAVNARSAQVLAPASSELITLDATDFSGLWRDIRAVARAAQVLGRGETLVAGLQARLEAVRRVFESRPHPTPRVLVLEWSDPPFVGGHWVPEIVARAGGICVPDEGNVPSRRAEWDELSALDPDVVLLAPCGYSLGESLEQGRELARLEPRFARLRAVQSRAVWGTDATRLFSRCTPASVRAVEVAAGILHPDLFAAPGEDEARRLD